LCGEHDLSTSFELGRALQQAIDAHLGVVVDLTKAVSIDLTILQTLLVAHIAAQECGKQRLAVVVPPVSAAARLRALVSAHTWCRSPDTALATLVGSKRVTKKGPPRP
jgi:anti-anti-sigma regulatory factor